MSTSHTKQVEQQNAVALFREDHFALGDDVTRRVNYAGPRGKGTDARFGNTRLL